MWHTQHVYSFPTSTAFTCACKSSCRCRCSLGCCGCFIRFRFTNLRHAHDPWRHMTFAANLQAATWISHVQASSWPWQQLGHAQEFTRRHACNPHITYRSREGATSSPSSFLAKFESLNVCKLEFVNRKYVSTFPSMVITWNVATLPRHVAKHLEGGSCMYLINPAVSPSPACREPRDRAPPLHTLTPSAETCDQVYCSTISAEKDLFSPPEKPLRHFDFPARDGVLVLQAKQMKKMNSRIPKTATHRAWSPSPEWPGTKNMAGATRPGCTPILSRSTRRTMHSGRRPT